MRRLLIAVPLVLLALAAAAFARRLGDGRAELDARRAPSPASRGTWT